MPDEEEKARRQGTGPALTQAMWSAWIEQTSAAGEALKEAWQVPPAFSSGMAADRTRPNDDILSRDPILGAIAQMWNANPLHKVVPLDWAEITWALRTVGQRALARPGTTKSVMEFNQDLWRMTFETWQETGRRWMGVVEPPSEGPAPAFGDKRFVAPEWQSNPAYRLLKEVYLLASSWLLEQGDTADMDEAERQRVNFHLRQFVDAMSPTLMLMSNPAALKRAMETGGASVAAGARNLMADLNAGRLSMVDADAYAPGRNLALTPGKVVHRNRLIELIQYEPTTDKVHAVPLLIVPPWINKYYILDMQPKNSMVAYLVAQGFTVFVISWKNPDASMDSVGIEDYMDLGPLEASDVARKITNSETVNVMGYCIGGTLMTMTLAVLAAQGDKRFRSASFMVSLQDFERVGDTAVFMDEHGLDVIERQMMERGYLDSAEMSNMFNLLRSNDLIWANVVNNYLLGNKPPAFDLLYWNSDGTRMARAAHSWYLRNTYRENNLVKPGKVKLKDKPIDLGRITLDCYSVGAEKDHIVPWDAAWRITQLFGGDVRFVLASSGHVAGIINPPGGKGAHWASEDGTAANTPKQWLQEASRREGSWWPDWAAWMATRSGRKGKPPSLGSDDHPPLQDAPGSYVMEK
ncbi:class I poly(R)-hydroxyalkanoic acid synthase (plasmid) [Paracoccus liaowanqingii]|uniref:Class I poly(R)-hydroxyalkanoic acid synthase n=1 Tax=Paracoccus liaowanqingii TaxID=2560053 RepID=A0A4Y5SU98_9RHOB|nr:class I poly(R)-hydroxyalkanoic acid synthase [Paracoccus liaowanqingii]QDA36919.1 class I poly(R)-hydroxyalkanoic acid synthase [Paracoccus liaowanqingii]